MKSIIEGQDYIVEQKITARYVCRKWASGLMEQWYNTDTAQVDVSTAWYTGLYYGNKTLTFTDTFATVRQVQVTMMGEDNLCFATVKGFGATQVLYRATATRSGTYNTREMIYVVGTWS